jgi:hypothetical protein
MIRSPLHLHFKNKKFVDPESTKRAVFWPTLLKLTFIFSLKRTALASPSSDPFFISSQTRRFSSTDRLRHLDSIHLIRSCNNMKTSLQSYWIWHQRPPLKPSQEICHFTTNLTHLINRGVVTIHQSNLQEFLPNL